MYSAVEPQLDLSQEERKTNAHDWERLTLSSGFNYNYGQYFVFWDMFGGSYRDPFKYAPYNGKPIEKAKKIK